jgi:transcriptional regulator with XRE-family HTH domain
MLKTAQEVMADLGAAIRARRITRNWSQSEAAGRAGMGVRTWRRMEASGHATVENLIKAAVALGCEEKFAGLFPAPAARSMDELLDQQRRVAEPRRRVRAIKRT